MNLTIAAIRSGTDPVGKLPPASFHRTLETPILCPKCDVTYNLIVDFDQTNSRWFPDESRALIMLLRKAIFMGHSTNHQITHFETSGVIVKSFTSPQKHLPNASL
jgi:hypothetical protein